MSVQDTPTRDSLRLESDKLVYDWGWIDCEERIIKLLEAEIERFEHEDFYAVGVTNGLIELIKGETK